MILTKAKSEIIRFWLTHHYLKRVAKKHPSFFYELINEITNTIRESRIMEKRYIDGQKFEAIAIDMGVDVRYIFRIHKQVIEKLINI